MMEDEIFKRRKICFDKLEKFGFVRRKEGFFYEREIYEGMIARVEISLTGTVLAKVYDKDFDEEYINHRLEGATGAFVVGVKNAYEALLYEIADAVSTENKYAFDQANRVDAFIAEQYGVSAEFLWKKFPHFGVYRNPASGKWFGIIMNIDRGKIVPGECGEIEVMNLKLDNRTQEFIKKGAYPSYHMNQASWVSVILDDTLDEDLIREMIAISFANANKKGKR